MNLIDYSILLLHNSSFIMADLEHDKTSKSSELKLISIYHYFSYKNVTWSDMESTPGGASRSIVDRKGKSIFRLGVIPKRTNHHFLQNRRGEM